MLLCFDFGCFWFVYLVIGFGACCFGFVLLMALPRLGLVCIAGLLVCCGAYWYFLCMCGCDQLSFWCCLLLCCLLWIVVGGVFRRRFLVRINSVVIT